MSKFKCHACKKSIHFWQEYEIGWTTKGELGRDIYHKKCYRKKDEEKEVEQ